MSLFEKFFLSKSKFPLNSFLNIVNFKFSTTISILGTRPCKFIANHVITRCTEIICTSFARLFANINFANWQYQPLSEFVQHRPSLACCTDVISLRHCCSCHSRVTRAHNDTGRLQKANCLHSYNGLVNITLLAGQLRTIQWGQAEG